MKRFREEYEEHIRDKKCRAKVCTALRQFHINPEFCIACGKCVESCKFGAIHLNEHGVAEVDEEKCIACGRCTRECPQHIIHLHDCANTIAVKCSNKDKGKDARGVCEIGRAHV